MTHLTMAEVWDELDERERSFLSEMTGLPQGQMSLSKISTILKATIYRYHDKPEIPVPDPIAVQRERDRYEHEIRRIEHEMKTRILEERARQDAHAHHYPDVRLKNHWHD